MEIKKRNDLSKFMSLILRHKPSKHGITLDPEGYVSLEDLKNSMAKESYWKNITIDDLLEVVRECPKQRFEVNDGYIKARYGHSHQRVKYPVATPPITLYHGTIAKSLGKIEQTGIQKMGREYVHLSVDIPTAIMVGSRRGKPIILGIDTAKAVELGAVFYNGGKDIWLSDFIPVGCFSVLS